MKIRIYSDLHLEFGRYDRQFSERGEEELVVLAGDIDVGTEGVTWAAETFPHVPVVYVLGNHEYYRQQFESLVAECRERASGTNVHVLECDAVDIGDIRVLGCTLWTDYELLGAERKAEAQRWAHGALADFALIKHQGAQPFLPASAAQRFCKSSLWLDQQITDADRPLLVVTHHAPTAATTSPLYQGQISNASFHSNAEHLMRSPVRMWVHGHTHHNVNLQRNGVHVLSNQWGYPNEGVADFRLDGLFTFAA